MDEKNIAILIKYANTYGDKSSAGTRDKRFFAIIRLVYFDRIFEDLDFIYENRKAVFSLSDESSKNLSRESIKKDLNILVNENILQKGNNGRYYPFLFTNLEFDLDAIYTLDINQEDINTYFYIDFNPNELESAASRLIDIQRLTDKDKENCIKRINVLVIKIQKNLKNPFVNSNKIKQILKYYIILKQDIIPFKQLQEIVEGLGYAYSDNHKACIINYLKLKNPNVIFNQ